MARRFPRPLGFLHPRSQVFSAFYSTAFPFKSAFFFTIYALLSLGIILPERLRRWVATELVRLDRLLEGLGGMWLGPLNSGASRQLLPQQQIGARLPEV